jgi:hypothetical protein
VTILSQDSRHPAPPKYGSKAVFFKLDSAKRSRSTGNCICLRHDFYRLSIISRTAVLLRFLSCLISRVETCRRHVLPIRQLNFNGQQQYDRNLSLVNFVSLYFTASDCTSENQLKSLERVVLFCWPSIIFSVIFPYQAMLFF